MQDIHQPLDYPDPNKVVCLHRGVYPIAPRNLHAIFETAAARPGEAVQTPPPPQRHSLFDAAVDALADFVADVCDRPSTALVLLTIGQWSVIIPALCWAVMR